MFRVVAEVDDEDIITTRERGQEFVWLWLRGIYWFLLIVMGGD